MKTRICSLMIAALLLMTLLPGCSAGAPGNTAGNNSQVQNSAAVTDTPTGPNENTAQISPEKAREIALNHAGFTADQVERLRTEYEIDDRVPQYDVEFHVNGVEYEFEIHAESGDIISYDRDTD